MSIPRSVAATHSNGRKHILQFVHQCNELRVVDTDPVQQMSLGPSVWVSWGAHEGPTGAAMLNENFTQLLCFSEDAEAFQRSRKGVWGMVGEDVILLDSLEAATLEVVDRAPAPLSDALNPKRIPVIKGAATERERLHRLLCILRIFIWFHQHLMLRTLSKTILAIRP